MKGHCYCTNEFYYETKELQIKDIKNTWAKNIFEEIDMDILLKENIEGPKDKNKTWKKLLEDIKINGIKDNLKVVKSKYGYEILDGNHRIKILEYLYGKDYKVIVDVYLNHKKYLPYCSPAAVTRMVDEVEYTKLIINQRLMETKNKIYGTKC